MVDEALGGNDWRRKCPPEDDDDDGFWQERLRYLLNYDDAFNDAKGLFTGALNRKVFIRAISEIKVIDPAVGSGAFPMSVLHKLTLALAAT